ncbi:thymidylate synthase, partial [Staphylococcus epidermidis]
QLRDNLQLFVVIGQLNQLIKGGRISKKECGLEVGEFIHTFGDAHIYSNHMDAIHTQLSRDSYLPPQLKINTDKSIFDINYEDLELINYESHPAIKAPIAV